MDMVRIDIMSCIEYGIRFGNTDNNHNWQEEKISNKLSLQLSLIYSKQQTEHTESEQNQNYSGLFLNDTTLLISDLFNNTQSQLDATGPSTGHYSIDHNSNMNVNSSSSSYPELDEIKHLFDKSLHPMLSSQPSVFNLLHNTSFLDGILMNNSNIHKPLRVDNDFQQQWNISGTMDNQTFQNYSHYNETNYPGSKLDECSSFSYEYEDFTQNEWVRDVFIALYVIVIALSIVGNLMVIYTVWYNQHMRTTTNYYIVNLALCDFLVATFVMPLKLLEYVAPCSWQVFGSAGLCSFVSFILPVFVFASVLTLVAISIER